MKKYSLWGVFVPVVLLCACVHMPKNENPQYTQQHYAYSILLTPDNPDTSPHLAIALSLVQMEYSAEQAEYLNEVLYAGISREEYRDRVVTDLRKNYRSKAPGITASMREDSNTHNWRYAEVISVRNPQPQGVVIERNVESYGGGIHDMKARRYLVIDLDELRQIKIDDLFANFHEERRLRDIVYEELRKYSGLKWGQPLSEGIFFTNSPELTFNFFITEAGLGLHWDPDQIAPYFHGDIEILLPWHAINSLMLYPGIELLYKFNIYLFDDLEEQ